MGSYPIGRAWIVRLHDTIKTERRFVMQALWKALLLFGITAMLVLFVMSGMDAFHKGPQYSDYVPDRGIPPQEVITKERCEELGGKWNAYDIAPQRPRPAPPPAEPRVADGHPEGERAGSCDLYFAERELYDSARREHKLTSFISFVMIGVLMFIDGLMTTIIRASSPVFPSIGGGFALAGVVLTVIGAGQYWGDMNAVSRFLLLGAGLAVIIVAALFIPKIVKRVQGG